MVAWGLRASMMAINRLALFGIKPAVGREVFADVEFELDFVAQGQGVNATAIQVVETLL